jgi:hypothetical protein
MKICGRCKQEKPLEDFAWKNKAKGTKQYQCRVCQYEYRTEHYSRNKEKIYSQIKTRQQELKDKLWEYKSKHPCLDCGETDPVVLEFDHLRDKEANVSTLVLRGAGWDTILAEIEKCEIVCANCHRRRTHKRGGWIRNATIHAGKAF